MIEDQHVCIPTNALHSIGGTPACSGVRASVTCKPRHTRSAAVIWSASALQVHSKDAGMSLRWMHLDMRRKQIGRQGCSWRCC